MSTIEEEAESIVKKMCPDAIKGEMKQDQIREVVDSMQTMSVTDLVGMGIESIHVALDKISKIGGSPDDSIIVGGILELLCGKLKEIDARIASEVDRRISNL